MERIVEIVDHGGMEGAHAYSYGEAREEIVRCRDCKWCMAYWKATYCDRFKHSLPTAELDGFCAWAERRA